MHRPPGRAGDDPKLSDRRVLTYGVSPQADIRAVDLRLGRDGARYDIVIADALSERGRVIRDLYLPMFGRHNVQNSLAAAAVSEALGLGDEALRAALRNFKGVKRRFTKTGEWNGVPVIDDYGHHPVEIAAVLKAARAMVSGKRCWSIPKPSACPSPTRFTARGAGITAPTSSPGRKTPSSPRRRTLTCAPTPPAAPRAGFVSAPHLRPATPNPEGQGPSLHNEHRDATIEESDSTMADPSKPIEASEVGEKGPGFVVNHSDPAGVPRPDVWRQAVSDFFQLDVDASVLSTPIGPAPLIVDADPLHMGIGPDAGEVTDIVIDPTGAADQTIYISSDDGGVWKTGDAGTTWTPLTDQMFSLSMGAIAMDPSNPKILYAGSGNLFDGGAVFTKSAGIYRSADGGSTWSIVDGGYFGTLFANIGINRIVCPAPDTLLVATDQGLYRSIDDGRNFGANPPFFNDRHPVVTGIICCLLLDSVTPASTVYCGVAGHSVDSSGNPFPTPSSACSNRSTAASPSTQTFLATRPPRSSPIVASSSPSRSSTAPPPNSAVLYASVQTNLVPSGVPTYVGLFRSTNSGSTWTAAPQPVRCRLKEVQRAMPPERASNRPSTISPWAWIHSTPCASMPDFSSCGSPPMAATTSRLQAVTASQVHWDNHAVVFSPSAHRPATGPTQLYTGTDGGIATSANGGGAWKCINGNLATNLFRGIDIGKGGAGTPPPNAYT